MNLQKMAWDRLVFGYTEYLGILDIHPFNKLLAFMGFGNSKKTVLIRDLFIAIVVSRLQKNLQYFFLID